MHGMTRRSLGVYAPQPEHDDTEWDWHEVVHWEVFWADHVGRQFPAWFSHNYEWHKFICNNTECGWWLLVREDRLVEFVAWGLEREGI